MRALLVLVVGASLLAASPASASETAEKTESPVVVLMGGERPDALDCKATAGKLADFLGKYTTLSKGVTHRFGEVVTVSTAAGDTGCDVPLDVSGGTRDVARAFAGWLKKQYGDTTVDVVAHGTAGVALRYALAKAASDPAWPHPLHVGDAVTVGAPHAGSAAVAQACPARRVCTDMALGSALLNELAQPAFGAPQAPGGTDWSVIASEADTLVSADSARAMDADHMTVYTDAAPTHEQLLTDVAIGRDAHIVFRHGDDDEAPSNKAQHSGERIALSLIFGGEGCGTDTGCSNVCRQELAHWQFQFTCPANVAEGVTGVTVTRPDGLEIAVPSVPGLDYALPLASKRRLRVPIVLPDLGVSAGGFAVSAVDNTLDTDGVTIGIASVTLREGLKATAYGLQIAEDGTISAQSLSVEALGGQLDADGVQFRPGKGLIADTATLGLPAALGGSAVTFSSVSVDAGGHISGRLSGGHVKVGDITADITKATFTDDGFSVQDARLTLPEYLGSANLHAHNVHWDGRRVTVERADGDVNFALAGGKLRVQAHVDFALQPNGGYELGGNGRLVVPGPSGPLFDAAASVRVKSVDCDPAPGPCRNAVYLQQAALTVELGRAIPLGSTGLALKGLGGSVETVQTDPQRDGEGTIHGVTYTFGLKAHVTSFPNDSILDGTIAGSLSTNGNFGFSLDATALGFIHMGGGMCVRFADVDTVCARHLPKHKESTSGTGAYVDVHASAGVSASGLLGSVHAQLEADAFGRVLRSGGQTYVDATLSGTLSAGAHTSLIPGIEGSAGFTAQIGRFNTPAGPVLGVKGTVEVNVPVAGPLRRSIFIDGNGHYIAQGVDDFKVATAAAVGDGHHEFRLRPRQTQTVVMVQASEGSPTLELTTPEGRRIVVPGSNGGAGIYPIGTQVPHAVVAYVPAAAPGHWEARVRGVAPGSYRLAIQGNQPLPRLSVRRPVWRHRSILLAGTLRDARGTVALYVGRGACGSRGGALRLTGVQVRHGAWHYRWTPDRTLSGRFAIHAELENGVGPLVSGCAKGAIVPKRPARHHRSRRGTHRLAHAARRHPTAHRALRSGGVARAAAKGRTCGAIAKNPPEVPVFDVWETKTEDIAKNDAAAIEALEETGQEAELHYGPYAKGFCRNLSKENRKKACRAPKGKRYHNGGKPGPPDGKLQPDKTRTGGSKTSCDEYPFANSAEGGSGARTQGVLDHEQDVQGGQVSAFRSKHLIALEQLSGAYHVCVHLKKKTVGICDHRLRYPNWSKK